MSFDFGQIEQSSWKENQCANACLPIAPTSECFHANMERVWGTALSSIYIIIPTLFVIMAIILFISEVHFLQRFARRKRVRYTLYWILGIYPAGMICHLIALYIPRSVIYMEFAVDIWIAYATNKLFGLVLMIHGGRRKFTQECFEAKSNAVPCCCFFCLPVVYNNIKWAKFMKWGIIQFCFMNVIIGYISIVLYSDSSWSDTAISPEASFHMTPDNYFSIIRLISTLICLYAANMFKMFQQSRILEGDFDEKHKINWKFAAVQILIFISGVQRLIFSALTTSRLIPCVAPLNWQRNMKVVESSVIIFEFFLLSILARVAFTRTDDLNLIRKHNNLPIEESDEDEDDDDVDYVNNQNYAGGSRENNISSGIEI